ncbi:MAG: PorV/PorQ family protein [Bacteroidota bacterium]
MNERNRNTCLSFLCILCACIPSVLNAQNVSKVGTTVAEFLQIGVGGRATAMGGAYVALANDVSSLRWNPAGAANIDGNEILATHNAWIAELDYNFVGAVMNLEGIGRVGISLTMLSVPEMLVRTEDFQQGNGERFDAADLALGVTYANSVGSRFNVGGTLKFVQQRIWHTSAQTFAFDLGTQYKTDFLNGMVIGASITNFGGTMEMRGRDLRTFVDPDPISEGNNDQVPVNLETDSWDLPVNFQFGISFMPIDEAMHQVTVAIDALHPSSNFESVNAGAEYGYMNQIFLRAGYESLFLKDTEVGLNAGVGIHRTLSSGLKGKVSYNYKSVGRLGDVHGLTLEIGF